jgi:hypothetical protein
MICMHSAFELTSRARTWLFGYMILQNGNILFLWVVLLLHESCGTDQSPGFLVMNGMSPPLRGLLKSLVKASNRNVSLGKSVECSIIHTCMLVYVYIFTLKLNKYVD